MDNQPKYSHNIAWGRGSAGNPMTRFRLVSISKIVPLVGWCRRTSWVWKGKVKLDKLQVGKSNVISKTCTANIEARKISLPKVLTFVPKSRPAKEKVIISHEVWRAGFRKDKTISSI